MAEILKQIIISMHGAFLPKKDYIDVSLKDFEEKDVHGFPKCKDGLQK